MSIDILKAGIGDYAKDIRLNLSKVLTPDGAAGLVQNQIFVVALSCAYAVKNQDLVGAILAESGNALSDAEKTAAKSAASIMAMNNIYYRFIHLVEDTEFAHMPAGLRMQILMNSGIDKKDFELCALAVSAINGCGMCMDSHVKTLIHEGVSKQAIQSAIKIASVIHATAQALWIGV